MDGGNGATQGLWGGRTSDRSNATIPVVPGIDFVVPMTSGFCEESIPKDRSHHPQRSITPSPPARSLGERTTQVCKSAKKMSGGSVLSIKWHSLLMFLEEQQKHFQQGREKSPQFKLDFFISYLPHPPLPPKQKKKQTAP